MFYAARIPYLVRWYGHKYRKRDILYLYASYYTTSCVFGQVIFAIFCIFSVFRRSAQIRFRNLYSISNIDWQLNDLSDRNPLAVRDILYHKKEILSRQIPHISKRIEISQETQDKRTEPCPYARYRGKAQTKKYRVRIDM